MKGHKAIIEILKEENVNTIFGYISEDNMKLLAEVAENQGSSFRFIHARHEQGAVAMADGYFRSTNRIGVCSVGRGPAIAQTGTALVTARKRKSQILIIVPEPAYSPRYSTRDIDTKRFAQKEFLKDTIGKVLSVQSSEDILPKFQEAFRRLHINEGPVAVQIPRDMLDSEIDGLNSYKSSDHSSATSKVHPNQKQIEEAVDLYLDSDATKMPTILAGKGAVSADVKDSIYELAELMNAALVTTLQARGYFSDHPFSLGFVGDYGHNLANRHVARSDYVLAIGCSLNPHTTDSGHVFDDNAKLVHIDNDKSSIEKYTKVDIGIVGDAQVTIEALVDEFNSNMIDQSGRFWTDSLKEEIAGNAVFADQSFEPTPYTIDPRELIIELDNALPEDRVVICDGGQCSRWVMDGITIHGPSDFIWTTDFAAIGQGLPVGIGTTVGSQPRPCYLFCGDASFMMSIQELDTAVRNNIPIMIFVLNDGALGMEYHQLSKTEYAGDSTVIPSPDFARVARSLGAEGISVTSKSELAEIDSFELTEKDGPVVIDCKVNMNVIHSSL